MKKSRRSKKVTPRTVCLLALVALALLILLVVGLLGHHGRSAGTDPGGPLAVELSEDWENWFLSPHTTEEQQTYITQTLDTVQKAGGDLVLLTGRAGGGCLFRTRDKALPTLSTVTDNDRMFHKKFDPVVFLMDTADERKISVALLATDEGGNPLSASATDRLAHAVQKFADKQNLAVFAPQIQPIDPQSQIYAYTDGEGTVLLRADGQPALLATAAMQSPAAGAVLGSYTALVQDPTDAILYRAFRRDNPTEPLLSQPVSTELAVAYPEEGAVLYNNQVFLMGTSDPAQPLSMNGRTVQRHGSRGVWGFLVEAQPGENTFTLRQGDREASVTFTLRQSSWTPAAPVSDGTEPAQPGQKLRITAPMASVLEDPANPDSIAMTCYEGALAQVHGSVPITLSGKKTYAYQLEPGQYVLAKNCELVDEPNASFTGVSVETLENGDQILHLQGQGTPLYYHNWEDNSLTLTFLSASFSGQWPAETGFVKSFEAGEEPDGFSVTMNFSEDQPLWGYHVEYTENGTQIVLKAAPALSDAETGPLTGITVLLDPGHGDDDTGAMGCAGPAAPQEKDVNLAVATAAKHRLEQLGATVVMSRTDDTFYSLDQRLHQLNTTRPDFFISIHHNSAPLDRDLNANDGGVEAYWFYTEGKPLAKNLVEAVGSATGRRQRGNFYNYFYVTRSNICPAVLLETGFMTVPAEYEKVADESVIWAEGGAIAQAIVRSVPR